MAAPVNTYKVIYHFENGGKKGSPEYSDYVQASASDNATIKAVLASNNKTYGAQTLVIDAVQNFTLTATGVLA